MQGAQGSRLWLWAAVIVAVEALLFAFPLHQLGAPLRGGDAAEYLRLASNLLHHGVFSDSQHTPFDPNVLRSPGYPALLALLQACGLGSLGAIRVVQLGLLGLTAWTTGAVAMRLAGARAGLIATIATATYLPLVWATTDQMTEVTAALGTAVVALLTLRAREREGVPALRAWALAGLALALSAYVRPSILAFAVPAAVLVAVETRRILPAAAFLAALIVTIAPWAARTTIAAHTPVALQVGSGAGRYASAQQNEGRLPIPLDGAAWVAYKAESRRLSHDLRRGRYTPVEQVEFDRRLGRAAPHVRLGDVVKRLPQRLASLWGPADNTPRSERWTASARRLALLQFWLLAVLAVGGLLLRRRSVLRDWPLWLPAVYLTAVHTVLHVELRYSLPVRPLLIVMAAVGAAHLWERRGLRPVTDRGGGLRLPAPQAR